jgi:hypothetical protein
MRTLTAVGLVTLAACASEPPPCGLKVGQPYEVASRELSGDCGDVGSAVSTAGEGAPPGCSDVDLPASGSCGMAYRRMCRTADGRAETVMVLTRNDDDATYTGRADVTLFSQTGAVECHSVYELAITPL